MGEYARYRGADIKIGTCEDMYYLRAQDRHAIEDYGFGRDVLDVVRFRFPFPDEDGQDPGSYDDHARGVRVPGYRLPETLSGDEHHSVQFTSTAGYVLSIPCPEGRRLPDDVMTTDVDGLRVGRNGFNGYPVVRQQAFRAGVLVTLLNCSACGGVHRLDTLADAAPVIEAFREEAAREEFRRDLNGWGPAHGEDYRRELEAIADRIEAGYKVAIA